jgi:hypothetical protein
MDKKLEFSCSEGIKKELIAKLFFLIRQHFPVTKNDYKKIEFIENCAAKSTTQINLLNRCKKLFGAEV